MWLTLNGRIRWVKFNGRIRWVKLNEGRRRWMRKGGKEDMRGKNTREKGTFGGRALFSYWETVLEHFFLEIGRLYYWFLVGEACCRTVTGGHLLLGVLGSGARNPYRILELGSQRGSVPSWLGG
jgi:hypothetical protein